MKIGNLPYSNAFKLEAYDPQNSIIKKLDLGRTSKNISADPDYGKFDIFLKSGDNFRGEVVSKYEANVLKDVLSLGTKGNGEFCEHFYNLKVQLADRYSNGEFTSAEYDELCSYVDKMEQEEGYARIKNSFGNMSIKDMAERCGDLGKHLDENYAAGKVTKKEYDELNVSLAKYIEAMAVKNERGKAFMAIGAEWGSSPLKSYEHYLESMSKTPEQYQQDLQDQITSLVESKFKIDRNLLLEMINSVRYGK